MIRCIENGVVLTPWGKEYEKCVFIRDGVIDAVCTKEEYGAKADETIDAKGEYVSAGFIDIHTHGGGGYDFMDGDCASFQGAARFHLCLLYTSIADVWINSHVPLGDANAEIKGLTQKVAGTSVLCNSFVWNLLLIETCRELVHRGVQPPVWCSANTVGGDEANYALEQKYFPRVKHLR